MADMKKTMGQFDVARQGRTAQAASEPFKHDYKLEDGKVITYEQALDLACGPHQNPGYGLG